MGLAFQLDAEPLLRSRRSTRLQSTITVRLRNSLSSVNSLVFAILGYADVYGLSACGGDVFGNDPSSASGPLGVPWQQLTANRT
jgi:hypothetical protein